MRDNDTKKNSPAPSQFREHFFRSIAEEIGQNSREKKNDILIDSIKETIALEPNGRSAQCQIIFYSRNTRRGTKKGRRGQENEDHQFSQALHIDLRYVFNGFDLKIEEDVARPLNHSIKIIDPATDNGLNVMLNYLLL